MNLINYNMIRTLFFIIFIIITSLLQSQVAIDINTEFEKKEKLLMVWPYDANIDSIVSEISGISHEHADIEIIFDPNNTTFDTTSIRNFLISMGTNGENLEFIPAITDTYKLRQFSPITGYGVFTDTLVRYFGNPGFSEYNRPNDDSIPYQLSDYYNFDLTNYGLKFEESNVQYDGLRYLFVGDRILEDNLPMSENDIRFSLNAYYNSGMVMFIPTPENSGGGELNGIENYIKVLDPETILVTSIPDSLPDYYQIEEIADQLSQIINYFGENFNIIRIPACPNDDGTFTTSGYGEIRSYTNSLLLNDLAIIPSFGNWEYDSIAREIYKAQLPGFEVVSVNAQDLSQNHEGIHTITKALPQEHFLRILHKKMVGIQEYYPQIKVNSLCNTGTQLLNMWLYYKKSNDTVYTKESVHLVCPQYFAIIEKVDPSDTIHYFLEANSTHATITYPLSAPAGNFTFWFDVVSETNDEDHELDYQIYPNPSTGSFTIRSDFNLSEEIGLRIINGTGHHITSERVSLNKKVNLEHKLTTGLYFAVINIGNKTLTKKLIIQQP